jgi:hypothetical protein
MLTIKFAMPMAVPGQALGVVAVLLVALVGLVSLYSDPPVSERVTSLRRLSETQQFETLASASASGSASGVASGSASGVALLLFTS